MVALWGDTLYILKKCENFLNFIILQIQTVTDVRDLTILQIALLSSLGAYYTRRIIT